MTTLARISVLSLTACAAIVAMAMPAHAQSSEQKVEGYVPPPLFGAPPISQQRPQGQIVGPNRSPAVDSAPIQRQQPSTLQGGEPTYVKPRVSRDNENAPITVEPYIPKFPPMAPVPMEQTPGGRGEIVERPRAPLAAPQPAKKPSVPPSPIETPVAASPPPAATPAPIVPVQPPAPTTTPGAAAPAPAPVVAAPTPAPAPAPVPLETKVAAPPTPAVPEPAVPDNAQPAQKVTSKGVVTGPKTMPSVPTGGVEKVETFTADEAGEKTLLEQHAERQQAEPAAVDTAATQPLPPLPAGFMPLAQIEAVDASRSRMTLAFAPGQADLNAEQRLTILHNLVPILSGDTGQSLMIQSYATPADKGQSSDRRIALSRALAIREALLDHGIEARRIDVRALGAPSAQGSTQGPADRTDLILTAR